MIKNIYLLFSDAKNFMMDEVNRIFILIIALFIIFGIYTHYEIGLLKKEINTSKIELQNKLEKTTKKIDYRYFNTSKTLEAIHKVKIDTKTGELKPQY